MQQLRAYTASTKENPNAMRVDYFDPVENYNLKTIFQGEYLNIDPPDVRLASADDFVAVSLDAVGVEIPNPRVALGTKIGLNVRTDKSQLLSKQPHRGSEVPLQTKAMTWQPQEPLLGSTLHGYTQARPYEVIIIASLIDNHINIGGLSRVSEIFGAKSLHINKLDVLKSPQFISVSVSSDVWLPIEELPVPDIPRFLRERRLEGYTIVGIEQTDRSIVLGRDNWKFPTKTVLVLGSEREGIPALLLSEMDVCVEIPQTGQTRSMNVQTAAAVVLYEYTRQHG
jgi:tRNA guanosine-2'-O-methyltransferase